jgi:hypothetical protein
MPKRERYLLFGLGLFYVAAAIGLGLSLHHLLK